MDWFLYDNGPRHERVKEVCILKSNASVVEKQCFMSILSSEIQAYIYSVSKLSDWKCTNVKICIVYM